MRRFALPALVVLVVAGSAAAAQQAVPGALFLDRWDANNDGRVTLSEVRTARARLFEGYDGDRDGLLSAAEFAESAAQGNAVRGNPRALRYGMDRNGDGLLSRSEFIAGSAIWMNRMDSDGNGVLTTADFGPNARGGGRGASQGRGPRWNNG